MTISYPLAIPTHTGIRGVDMRASNAVAYNMSPFTFAGQAQAYPGQMWLADITLPPMKRTDAEQWIAWLVSLRGQYGTFTMGDPLGCTPRGVGGGTPLVNGSSQTGQDLVIDGCATSVTGWLKAGDYVQLGSGSFATLHKVLQQVNTDSSGNATLTLWPHIRTAPANNAAITISNTVGRWRLASNETAWSVNEAAIFGISFSAVEVI